MSKKEKSTLFTYACIGVASVGGLLFLLSFGLPYWVGFNDDVSVTRATGIHNVNLRYTYGFWRYCNKQTSDVGNTDLCDAVDTHTDVEQATICLLLLTMILYASTLVNSVLYLSLFKKEILCLYISLISIIVASVLSLIGVINFGTADHSITINDSTMLNFKASNLSASYWLAVVGCIDAVATAVIVFLAIRANRNERIEEDEKSMIQSSDANMSNEKLNLYDDDGDSDLQEPEVHLPEESPAHAHFEDKMASSSSSSSSDSSDSSSSDSEDSDIDSQFAKLKFKKLRTDDTRSEHRPESSKSSARKHVLVRQRSQSVPNLAPVEQAPTVDFSEDVKRVKTEQILYSIFHSGDFETNHPPPSTLISDLTPVRERDSNDTKPHPHPRPVAGPSNDFQRAKTEIIISKTRNELAEQMYVDVEDTVIELEETEEKTPHRKPRFLQKKKKKSVKSGKHVEKKRKIDKKIKDVYGNQADIPVFPPTRGNAMPAPWTVTKKKRNAHGEVETPASIKWALVARGVYNNR